MTLNIADVIDLRNRTLAHSRKKGKKPKKGTLPRTAANFSDFQLNAETLGEFRYTKMQYGLYRLTNNIEGTSF